MLKNYCLNTAVAVANVIIKMSDITFPIMGLNTAVAVANVITLISSVL